MLTLAQVREQGLQLHAHCRSCRQPRRVRLDRPTRWDHYNLVMLLDSRKVRCIRCHAPASALWISRPPRDRRRVLEAWPHDSAAGWTPPELAG